MANYIFRDPQKTATLEEFRECQTTDDPSYANFSFKDEWYYPYLNTNIMMTSYNVVSDYIDDIIIDFCYGYEMTDKEFLRYKYRPKLFAYDKYNCLELGYMILLLNDMYSFKQFTKKKIIAPNKIAMKAICERIFNANKEAITYYNSRTTGQPTS